MGCVGKKNKNPSPLGLSLVDVGEIFLLALLKKKKKRQKETDVKGVSDTISAKISHAALS